jgi:hypothetical protein
VAEPSVPAVIEMVDAELGSYSMSPAREPKLNKPEEVQEAIRRLKVSKGPDPNGVPKRALKHLSHRAVLLLVQVFNAILLTHYFPTLWKYVRVISTLKPGKEPVMPSSHRSISLLETIGKMLLTRILNEVVERGLLLNEQFGFRNRHSTSLQLACLVEKITRNFGEKRLTGAVFLDVAKAFDTVWIDGFLYKLTLLNFPSFIELTISAYLRGRTFKVSFMTATSSRRKMRAGVAQGGLTCPVLFSLYVNDIPSRSRHVLLALYADDTAIIATSRISTLLVSYLECYLSDFQRWLSEWRIAINLLTPNDPYRGLTAPLTSRRYILYIYSTNIGTKHFKHAARSPFSSLQNAVCFIMLPFWFLYYSHLHTGCAKIKKKSGAKRLMSGKPRDHLRSCRAALHPAPTINTLRGTNPMGRHNSLSGGDPRYTTHLVASHRPGQRENFPKNGHAVSSLE